MDSAADLAARLNAWAAGRGYRVAWGGLEALDLVIADVAGLRSGGLLDPTFDQQRLAGLRYDTAAGAATEGFRSVVAVGVPRPAHRVLFETASGPLEAVIPPTYVSYYSVLRRVAGELASEALWEDDAVRLAAAPLKALAARLGLVRYGRNNITYLPGSGSYHQLVGCLTTSRLGAGSAAQASASATPAAGPDGAAPGPRPAEECGDCHACQRACPTGAAGPDRFLLHAERCLTFLNESEEPWPGWLAAGVHHCLVGCLRCQLACPLNRGLLRYEMLYPSFTVDETRTILAAPPREGDASWDPIKAKLIQLGLPGYETTLTRNLRALAERPAEGRGG